MLAIPVLRVPLMSKIAAHLSLVIQQYLPFIAGRNVSQPILSSFFSQYRKTRNIAHFQYLSRS